MLYSFAGRPVQPHMTVTEHQYYYDLGCDTESTSKPGQYFREPVVFWLWNGDFVRSGNTNKTNIINYAYRKTFRMDHLKVQKNSPAKPVKFTCVVVQLGSILSATDSKEIQLQGEYEKKKKIRVMHDYNSCQI